MGGEKRGGIIFSDFSVEKVPFCGTTTEEGGRSPRRRSEPGGVAERGGENLFSGVGSERDGDIPADKSWQGQGENGDLISGLSGAACHLPAFPDEKGGETKGEFRSQFFIPGIGDCLWYRQARRRAGMPKKKRKFQKGWSAGYCWEAGGKGKKPGEGNHQQEGKRGYKSSFRM